VHENRKKGLSNQHVHENRKNRALLSTEPRADGCFNTTTFHIK